MKTFHGGEQVKGGYYWNKARWEVVPVKGEVAPLPGGTGEAFVKVSAPLLFALAPAVGGACLLLAPLIGFAMATWAVGRRIGLLGTRVVGEAAATMTPTWRPGEAHFAGRAESKDGEPGAPSAELDALESEVESKKDGAAKP